MNWYKNGKKIAVYYKAIIGTRLISSELLRNEAMSPSDVLTAIQSGYYDPTILNAGNSDGGTTIARAACLKTGKDALADRLYSYEWIRDDRHVVDAKRATLHRIGVFRPCPTIRAGGVHS